MKNSRIYRSFTYKEAVFRICSSEFDAITKEIVKQREILEDYISKDPQFQKSLVPVLPMPNAPESVLRMIKASVAVGIGPMSAVAGTMAQLAVEFAVKNGATDTIIENGGDIYLHSNKAVTVGLHSGIASLHNKLAFLVEPNDMPLAICSSSSKMGHSMSFGDCDLATVISKNASLADSSATLAGNIVKSESDVDTALNKIIAIDGVDGVLIAKNDKIGLIGQLPQMIKIK